MAMYAKTTVAMRQSQQAVTANWLLLGLQGAAKSVQSQQSSLTECGLLHAYLQASSSTTATKNRPVPTGQDV